MFCENSVKEQTPVVFVWGEGVLQAGKLPLPTGLDEFCRRRKERAQVPHVTGASAAPPLHTLVICPYWAVEKENDKP